MRDSIPVEHLLDYRITPLYYWWLVDFYSVILFVGSWRISPFECISMIPWLSVLCTRSHERGGCSMVHVRDGCTWLEAEWHSEMLCMLYAVN